MTTVTKDHTIVATGWRSKQKYSLSMTDSTKSGGWWCSIREEELSCSRRWRMTIVARHSAWGEECKDPTPSNREKKIVTQDKLGQCRINARRRRTLSWIVWDGGLGNGKETNSWRSVTSQVISSTLYVYTTTTQLQSTVTTVITVWTRAEK